MSPDPSPVAPTSGKDQRRSLTRLQAAVIDSILSGEPGSERHRIRLTGIAPRTYQTARQRALESEWVTERFVPDPTIFGHSRLSFVLARPSPEEFDATIARWREIERPILLWRTSRVLFGVFSGTDQDEETPVAREVAALGRNARAFILEANLKAPTLPIYFDFEGEWAQVVGIPGTSFYPRHFPRHPRGSARARAAITPRWKETVVELSAVPLSGQTPPPPSSFVSRMGARASLARALRIGWMDRRAFLNPSTLPPYENWALDQVVFVHGRLREGRRPESLLRTLFVSCAVHPFLFAASAGNVLFASLSPAPTGELQPRRSVSVAGTLGRFLERVEVDRLPAQELETLVPHETGRFAEA